MDFFVNEDLENTPLKTIKIYNEYVSDFVKQNKIKKLRGKKLCDFIKSKEINKLLYFVLTFDKKVVFYNIPLEEAKVHKKILGYEFSDRKGYEGIKYSKARGKLYSHTI